MGMERLTAAHIGARPAFFILSVWYDVPAAEGAKSSDKRPR